MINLSAAQCKTAGFMTAKAVENSDGIFVITFEKQSVEYGVIAQDGKTKTYKSVATAASFAKECGVKTFTVEFLF